MFHNEIKVDNSGRYNISLTNSNCQCVGHFGCNCICTTTRTTSLSVSLLSASYFNYLFLAKYNNFDIYITFSNFITFRCFYH